MTDYSVLSDFEINKRVFNLMIHGRCWDKQGKGSFDYCNNPADVCPIIVDNKISLLNHWDDEGENIESTTWSATTNIDMTWFGSKDEGFQHSDKNPLRAAMIVFLQMQENKQ